jgi:disulfide bond formation protein DsbB
MAEANRAGFDALDAAKAIALGVPAALLAGAYGSQYIGGLAPCEMCYWQRYAHWAGLAFAIAAYLLARMPDRGRSFVWLAALAILTSGAVGAYHAGVEAGVFEGLTQCTSMVSGSSTEELLRSVMSAPMVRCDQIQFEFLGISMAGWNAILSIAAALVILWLSFKRPRPLTGAPE